MYRLLKVLSGFCRDDGSSVGRLGHRFTLPDDRLLHRRSLRLEWLEDRSLLSVAPTGVDLLPGSDSGILDDDDLTNLDNSAVEKALQFEVAGTVAGATVTLYADGTAIGSTTATGDTTTVTTNGTYDLTDGSRAITARQTESGGTQSGNSPSLAVTIDTARPFQGAGQIAKLLADDGAASDNFGYSVAIDGSTALVGAPYNDEHGTDSGAVYVFENTDMGWIQVDKLISSYASSNDRFGASVSISGTVAVVGAPYDNGSAGVAYVFEDNGSGWVEVARLSPDGGGAGADHFGIGVSISGSRAIIGVHGDDDLGTDSGSAYIFEDTGSSWKQVAKLTAADGAAGDYFGWNVSISGTTAIVGARLNDDHGSNSGSAYIFEDTGSGWTQVAKLTDDDGASLDYYGCSVSINGSVAVVGASGDDDHGTNSGSVFVFEKTGATWEQVAKLGADDAARYDAFGYSVAISGNRVIVGASDDDDNGYNSGSAYLFENTGSAWEQSGKLTANDGADYDYFGISVSISGTTAFIGSYGDDDNVSSSGSAYLFGPLPPPDLQAASDTGVSDTDDITSDSTPTFDVADVGDYFRIYRDGTQISGDYETGLSYTLPVQFDGTYDYTLTLVDAAGNESLPSAALHVTIDTEAPATPAAPDLLASSDRGVSSTDNLTNDSTPTFGADGAPYFRLDLDGIQISGDYESTSYTAPYQSHGTYGFSVRAVDAAGNISNPSAVLYVTIDTEAPPVPPALDLQATSDTGVTDTDDVTNDATPTFDVTAAPYFRVYRDYYQISSDYQSGNTYTAETQVDGTHDYRVRAVDAAGNVSAGSDTLVVTIDTAGPIQLQRVAKLLADDGAAADLLGYSVAISGTTAIVGALLDDDNGSGSGSAYIFEDTGSGWTQIAKLTASDGAEKDYFGCSVAISGSVAIVGAKQTYDISGSGPGLAYVFEDTGAGWIQVAKLTAGDSALGDYFGCSVSISGTVAIVGADGDDDNGGSSGSAYVFEDTGTGWIQVAKLTADDGEVADRFGGSVSISGTTAIIGASGDDDNGSSSGSAYIFENTGSGWSQVVKLTADDGAAYDRFGDSVSISGTTAIVGAWGDDENGDSSGSAYVFQDTGTGWIQVAKLMADDAAVGEYFGQSVSISGSEAIVGAFGDGPAYSSAYLFEHTASGWTQLIKLTTGGGSPNDGFGLCVSINNGMVIVGAPYDDDHGNAAGSAYVFSNMPQLTEDTGISAHDQITSDTTPELAFPFNEPVHGQDSDVTVLDPNSNPVTPDSITGWGTDVLTITFDTPLTVEGEYTITLNGSSTIIDAAGNSLNDGEDENVTFTIDTVGPAIEHVLVKGTAWDEGFLDYLDSQGLGHPSVARLGYRLPSGTKQLDTLAWGNVDTITIAFSEDTVVAEEDLTLCGMNVPIYDIASFSYDSETHAATWTLATPNDTDRLWINLPDTVQDPAGNALDGEWETATNVFPSGDGSPGGHFGFAVNVLPGDADGDGIVGPADASTMAANWGDTGAACVPGDFTGDGAVNADDAAVLASHWGTQLPPWLPGDADYSGTVDKADAAILASHWGQSGKTWGDGDFDGDGIVGPADAAILAANFGATNLPPAEEAASEPPVPSAPVTPDPRPLVGPLPASELPTARQLIKPMDRQEDVAPLLMNMPTAEFSPEQAVAACDAALVEQVEQYGRRQLEPTRVQYQNLAWSQTLAQRQTRQQDKIHKRAALAVDLLLAQHLM